MPLLMLDQIMVKEVVELLTFSCFYLRIVVLLMYDSKLRHFL